MRELLNTQKIYTSGELQNFILSLESKYKIESAQEKYHNLVNFSANEDVPYHKWFKYREGFSADLITELILMSGAKRGEVIVDPFCGSGTTNVVAVFNGYHSLGLDINPMSAFITNTKITHYKQTDLIEAKSYLSDLSKNTETAGKQGYDDVRRYFNTSNFIELIHIKTFIDSLPDSKAKNLLFAAYIFIIMDCSDRKRDGNGLKTSITKIDNVTSFFETKVHMILNDIKSIQPSSDTYGFGIYGTANKLYDVYNKFLNKHPVGTIIFSPPYANSFDYFESYKLELVLGNYTNGIKGMNDLRKNAVRSFIGAEPQTTCDKFVNLLAQEIENAIPDKENDTGKKDNRTRKVPNMIRGYFTDMQEVIRQCSLTLESGKKTYIVVDQSAYVGKIIPTDLLFAYFGEMEGFIVNQIIECRNARTSTQQLNKYPYLKTNLRESIVELVKK